MRYNDNSVPEMTERLSYLMVNFADAISNNNNTVYTGPRVDNARSLRAQDFVPVDLGKVYVAKLGADLLAAAAKTGETDKVIPEIAEVANRLTELGVSNDERFAPIMQYKR